MTLEFFIKTEANIYDAGKKIEKENNVRNQTWVRVELYYSMYQLI